MLEKTDRVVGAKLLLQQSRAMQQCIFCLQWLEVKINSFGFAYLHNQCSFAGDPLTLLSIHHSVPPLPTNTQLLKTARSVQKNSRHPQRSWPKTKTLIIMHKKKVISECTTLICLPTNAIHYCYWEFYVSFTSLLYCTFSLQKDKRSMNLQKSFNILCYCLLLLTTQNRHS